MRTWRMRAQLRRRARRRYLAIAFGRWSSAGQPRAEGRPSGALVTLLWLLLPLALAGVAAVYVWLAPQAGSGSDVKPELALVLLPVLGVWLLRRWPR
jgi:hypothetical protein